MEQSTIYEHAKMLDGLRRDLTTLARQVGSEWINLSSDEEEHSRRHHLMRAQSAVWDAANNVRYAAQELLYLHEKKSAEVAG